MFLHGPSGSGANRWVRPLVGKSSSSQIGAIGASLVAAQQSAPVSPAPAPVGCAYFDPRRQGICNLWDAAGTVVGGNAAGVDPNLGKS
jgi:hypothetical protein